MFKKILLSFLLLTAILNATVPTQKNVTKLYVATFNRAPDTGGLNFWVNNSGLDIESIAKSFFEQSETQEAYPPGSSNTEFISAVYLNLFNRAADQEGLDYWSKELDSDHISKSKFILATINGAQGNDANILTNKTTVGLAFANAGMDNIENAKDIMFGITDDRNSVVEALKKYNINIELPEILDSTTIVTISGESIQVDKTAGGFIFHGYEEKIVLLEVYGDTCPHCISAIPSYNKLQAKYPNDVVVIALESYGTLYNASKQQYTTIPRANTGSMFSFIQNLTGYTRQAVPYLLILDRNGDYTYAKILANFPENEIVIRIQQLL